MIKSCSILNEEIPIMIGSGRCICDTNVEIEPADYQVGRVRAIEHSTSQISGFGLNNSRRSDKIPTKCKDGCLPQFKHLAATGPHWCCGSDRSGGDSKVDRLYTIAKVYNTSHKQLQVEVAYNWALVCT